MYLMCFYIVLIGILFRKADGVTGKLLYSNCLYSCRWFCRNWPDCSVFNWLRSLTSVYKPNTIKVPSPLTKYLYLQESLQ